jgi:hypothetical protein
MSKEGGLAAAHATFHELLGTNEGLVKGAEEWIHVQVRHDVWLVVKYS